MSYRAKPVSAILLSALLVSGSLAFVAGCGTAAAPVPEPETTSGSPALADRQAAADTAPIVIPAIAGNADAFADPSAPTDGGSSAPRVQEPAELDFSAVNHSQRAAGVDAKAGEAETGAAGSGSKLTFVGDEKQPSSGQEEPATGTPYQWSDGDRTFTALLQDDLTIGANGKIRPSDQSGETRPRLSALPGAGDDLVLRGAPDFPSDSQPVFKSQSGALMTLPGGVMLALDESWSPSEVSSFLALNGIDQLQVSELKYMVNGFFVATAPGFPSLELANSLAAQPGVDVASPNWRREVSTK